MPTAIVLTTQRDHLKPAAGPSGCVACQILARSCYFLPSHILSLCTMYRNKQYSHLYASYEQLSHRVPAFHGKMIIPRGAMIFLFLFLFLKERVDGTRATKGQIYPGRAISISLQFCTRIYVFLSIGKLGWSRVTQVTEDEPFQQLFDESSSSFSLSNFPLTGIYYCIDDFQQACEHLLIKELSWNYYPNDYSLRLIMINPYLAACNAPRSEKNCT